MKVILREPTLLEQLARAINEALEKKTHIDHVELTSEEFNSIYSSLDRSRDEGGRTRYTFRSIEIRVAPA